MDNQPKAAATGGTFNRAKARHLLILQGPLSKLYGRIADHLVAADLRVTRINLCAGDALFWGRRPARAYRGSFKAWPNFIRTFMRQEGVTELLLHGDRRPYHKAAIDIANALDVPVAATELGLLRSGWLSIERGGAGILSHFPEDPEAIKAIAASPTEVSFEGGFPTSFADQAKAHLSYHLASALGWPLYPQYQRYLATNPLADYPFWLKKLATTSLRKRRENARLKPFWQRDGDLFILPLQLEGDFQLRALSPFSSMAEVIERVIGSFAKHAPLKSRLLIKTHPLDHGAINWARLSQECAIRYRVTERVACSEFCNLTSLLPDAAGLVTVNSTAGFEALLAGCPTLTLAPAHFDLVGLTHQQGLNHFWTSPTQPDRDLTLAYQRALALTTHVPGSLTDSDGVEIAARHMANRLISQTLNEPGGFVTPPPRLARAKAAGCPL